MNILVLYPNFRRYSLALIKKLIDNNHKIFLMTYGGEDIFYDDYLNQFKPCFIQMKEERETIRELISLKLDLAIISLSHKGPVYKIGKELSKNKVEIWAACDIYWKNEYDDWKQRLIGISGKLNFYNKIFVPGYLARDYAIKIGFKDSNIIEGLYSADSDLFSQVGSRKNYTNINIWPKSFGFVGEYSLIKGFDLLVKAYKIYRTISLVPWKLICIGRGVLGDLIKNVDGIEDWHSQSNYEISQNLNKIGALVLPSRKDHWPLVVHEAMCAGLPIIISNKCGNRIELVQDNKNGFIFNIESIDTLVDSMLRMEKNPNILGEMSFRLSNRYSSNNWNEIINSYYDYKT